MHATLSISRNLPEAGYRGQIIVKSRVQRLTAASSSAARHSHGHDNELIQDGIIKIAYCPTKQMPADAPSKPMHAGSEGEILKRLTYFRC